MLAPVNSFEFQPCGRTPQVGHLTRWLRHRPLTEPTPSVHRLRLGLPGYLILFAPLAFAAQRQYWASNLLSPLVFLQISTHFTATPGIPVPPTSLKTFSLRRPLPVEPEHFRQGLLGRLRALYAQ